MNSNEIKIERQLVYTSEEFGKFGGIFKLDYGYSNYNAQTRAIG